MSLSLTLPTVSLTISDESFIDALKDFIWRAVMIIF